MMCQNCGSTLNYNNICPCCGRDNVNDAPIERKVRLGVPFVVFLSIGIFMNVIIIIFSLFLYSSYGFVLLKVLAVISMTFSALDIALSAAVLKMKTFAFKLYMGLNIANIILRLISYGDFIYLIIRSLLMYFIYKYEADKFEQ